MSRKSKYTSDDSMLLAASPGCAQVLRLLSVYQLSGSLTVRAPVHPVNPPVSTSLELTTLVVSKQKLKCHR